MKTNKIDALLALTDDFDLCNGVFSRFADFHNQIDVDLYSQEERVITLAWHASGLINNGGFEYLFEGWFTGDPGYVFTAAAFKTARRRIPSRAGRGAQGDQPAILGG